MATGRRFTAICCLRCSTCRIAHRRLSPPLTGDWAARFAAPEPRRLTNCRRPGERLRVGYVSPDFRQHSVAYFIEGVLAAHDHRDFEIFLYADVIRPDAVTHRIQGYADHWRNTASLSDEALSATILADELDILVDLAGHTARNRMLAFAGRLAPVQISWLGVSGNHRSGSEWITELPMPRPIRRDVPNHTIPRPYCVCRMVSFATGRRRTAPSRSRCRPQLSA